MTRQKTFSYIILVILLQLVPTNFIALKLACTIGKMKSSKNQDHPPTKVLLCMLVLHNIVSRTAAFTFTSVPNLYHPRTYALPPLSALPENTNSKNEVSEEVQDLLARAKAIRDTLPKEIEREASASTRTNVHDKSSNDKKGSVEESAQSDQVTSSRNGIGYRLYFDLGREDGTWMDPTWGRSGQRIEGSFDVFFQMQPNSIAASEPDLSLATQDIIDNMVKDNLSGKSTAVRTLESSPNARLRGGFEKMKCYGGGYRIDVAKRSSTARFYLDVEGTEDGVGNYGDIFIPKGCLYFSLPCFNNSVKQLSSKEGIVTVRQMGWHTGWRREESRIVGVFRAVPIEKARKKDRY